jgi:hypothetical protein
MRLDFNGLIARKNTLFIMDKLRWKLIITGPEHEPKSHFLIVIDKRLAHKIYVRV